MLVPQLTERLRDAENESMAKIAELEKQLSQARKELETLRVRSRGSGLGGNKGWAGLPRTDHLGASRLDTSLHPGKRMGAPCQACRWFLTPPLGLAGALQRVDPIGHLQTSL